MFFQIALLGGELLILRTLGFALGDETKTVRGQACRVNW